MAEDNIPERRVKPDRIRQYWTESDNMMIKKRFRNAVFIFLFISPMFSGVMVAKAEPVVVDRIVAIVNQDIVTLSDLSRITSVYEKAIKDKKYPPEQEKELLFRMRKDAIDRLIEKTLTDQEVKRYGISVTDKEVDASIERFKEQGMITEDDFRKTLAKEGMTIEAFRADTRERLLRSKLVNAEIKSKIVITEEDIKKYYEKTTGSVDDGKKYHLFHILKSYGESSDQGDDSSASKADPKEEMDQIISRLKNGEDFSTLAKLKSESPTAESGGDLGLFPLADLSDEIKTSVESLNPGEFTDIIRTSQGYQIFFLKEIVSEKPKSYKESSPEIEEKLYNEIIEGKFKSWLDGLKEKSYIKIIN